MKDNLNLLAESMIHSVSYEDLATTLSRNEIQLQKYLGCGAHGYVFLTDGGDALKIQTNGEKAEFRAAKFIAQCAEQDGPETIPETLPIIHCAYEFPEINCTAILREDLDDSSSHPLWEDLIRYNQWHSYLSNGYRTTAYARLETLESKFLGNQVVIDQVNEFRKLVDWLENKKFWFYDLHNQNWGMRKDGSLVIRDMSCNSLDGR